jgi:Na+/H+ antiporter NhaD/arsenite permease-like protein
MKNLGNICLLILLTFLAHSAAAQAKEADHLAGVEAAAVVEAPAGAGESGMDRGLGTGPGESGMDRGLGTGPGESEDGAPHVDGASLGLVWVIPFVGMLLSIAIFPLVAPHFWHNNFGKISAFWVLSFILPFGAAFGVETALYETLHTVLLEYLPFIILLFALFTVSGGVRLTGGLRGSPVVNTGILAAGTVLASFMGTTGAAMLFIRPLLRANARRRYNVHVVIFFIFLVANIGGSLTPLGDPPLFLGFLKGVDFFWPTQNMLLPMALVSTLLLGLFFALDSYLFQKEGPLPAGEGAEEGRLGLEGAHNILLLGGVLAAVLMSGLWRPQVALEIYHVHIELQDLVRDLLLLVIVFVSFKATSAESLRANAFTWFPIIEVAKLFAGIFLTIIPAIAILKAGAAGALGPLVSVLSSEGQPVNALYFWLTGILSSFLDNAPTYLVFFNTAGGDPEILMGPLAATLLAISCGAVFMGAMTYVGNAPNFMVRAIAQERGVPMPSFFGYMAWSCGILIPIFALVTVIFFV